MKRFTTVSDWGYYDTLESRKLDAGQFVKIGWPDGTDTIERIEIEHGKYHIEDHGHKYMASNDRAYIDKVVNGAPFKIYIRDGYLLGAWPE